MRLLNLISGWVKMPLADGLVLVPQDGPAVAAVRIREKVRPLRGMRAVIDEIVASLPEHRSTMRVGPLRRLTTAEGEHAGIVTLSAKEADGGRMERTLGLIAGDDFYAQVDGAATHQDRLAEVRELVSVITENYFLGLGELRRRRYFYKPPAGWQGIAKAHSTRYYHPDYPQEPAILVVYDTRPAAVTLSEVTDRVLFLDYTGGMDRDPPEAPTAISNRYGLSGQLSKITGQHPSGRHLAYLQATLVDGRFAYVAHLETTAEALPRHTGALLSIVESIEPVPIAKAQVASELIQWVD